MPEIVELRVGDIDASFASAWDALPPAREAQADIYDSHAWFAAWLSSMPDGTAERVRIPAVLDGGRPVAMLPLVVSGGGLSAQMLGMQNRTRARPVIGTEEPQQEVLELLAEAVARCGVRDVNLHRMPSRDPAAVLFAETLRDAGYRVTQHERSCDNLAPAEGGWTDYARTFKGFAGSAKRVAKRLEALWDVEVDVYGLSSEYPARQGFLLYDQLHQRSWKGQLSTSRRQHRADLLERAEANGWTRVFILRVAGVPAAADVWLRLGSVATGLSTAYDQRLASLSPGTLLFWEAQARLFAEDPPRLIDHLPGTNSQKDRLTLSKPPLLVTEAYRPAVWSGVTFPLRWHAQQVRAAIASRIRARRRPSAPSHQSDRVVTATGVPEASNAYAYRLDLTAAHRRYLATAAGEAAPEKMAASWDIADEWWVTGDGPDGLIRIALEKDSVAVREIVRLNLAADPRTLITTLASVLDREVTAREVPLHDTVLPWPRSWQPAEVGDQG